MKKDFKYYIALLFGAVMLFTACEEEKPDFFDESANSVYFNYEYASEFSNDINFANFIINTPESIYVNVKLRILGYVPEETRKVALKAKEVSGYELPEIDIPEVTFAAGDYEKEVPICVWRPKNQNVEYKACLYINGDEPGTMSSGVEGRSEYYITVSDKYDKPADWTSTSLFQNYLGDWNPLKHRFLVKYFNSDTYISDVLAEYDQWLILAECNANAVKTMRENGGDEDGNLIDFPFHTDCEYDKPLYWTSSHDKYLGEYTNKLFVHITKMLGITTANENEILGNESSLAELNKQAAKIMMETYNKLFIEWGLGWKDYYNEAYIPMLADIDYEVVRPIFWSPESPDGVGGKIIKQYYGEYRDEKYKFMIETFIKKKEAENQPFILLEMFPIKYNNSSNVISFDTEVGGITSIREYQKLFKNAYKSAPAGTYGFTFP